MARAWRVFDRPGALVVDDIVALKATLLTGQELYFLTWGRLFDPVDAEPLIEVVRPHVMRMARDPIRDIRLCESLQEAAGTPFFFEAFFKICQERIPFGRDHPAWAKAKADELREGKGIHFLGRQDDEAAGPSSAR